MVSAIVPALNEAQRVAATIEALCGVESISEVVVVDDGSTDETSQVAEAAGAQVVKLQSNNGKGRAVLEGVKVARGDILLFLDADLQQSARQASLLLQPILDGSADMAIATFPVVPGRGGGFGFAVRLAQRGILKAAGRRMEAPLSGQRALRREVIERVGKLDSGFGLEVGLTIDALRLGFRVVEVPTTMTHRVTGRDFRAMLHRLKQYLAIRAALRRRT
jgi:glycosyltransferase involved in cell wall biosynthesis